MQSLSRILLPVDFSERSLGAARYARLLASHFHSEITLLHVLIPPQYEFGALDIGGSMLVELYQNRSEQAAKELECFAPAELEGLSLERVVREGDPAGKIVEFAHEQPADLIIMPTHGYGPFRRFILGSNTARVLHDADCPVWTGVHLEEAPAAPVPLRSVLCAVDLGPQSYKTLCWASWLAREFDSRLTLLHVTTSAPSPAVESARKDVRDAAREELLRLQTAVGAEAQLSIEGGDAAHAICSAAARVEAGLLVIGRGSAAGVFGRLRTNAYAIIRQSPCPVVSV